MYIHIYILYIYIYIYIYIYTHTFIAHPPPPAPARARSLHAAPVGTEGPRAAVARGRRTEGEVDHRPPIERFGCVTSQGK